MNRDFIYIIDTFSLMFQVFHAIPPMTGTQGQPTNAVFGFTRDIMAIRERRPAYLVCAFDSPGPGRREELYEQYKANRSAMPEDLSPQIPLIRQVLEGFRIPVIEHAGWEADDVIATLTARSVERGLDVIIVSTDKDTRQLLGPQVRLFNCRRNTFMDEAGLMDDWGVRPDQVVDFQALVGDSVDNVPGVPKVGPKTARGLIEQFGTLDNILANAGKAPGRKLSENLVTFADQARLSRELVRLRTDLALDVDFESARLQQPDYRELYNLFSILGFRRYASDMRKELADSMPAESSEQHTSPTVLMATAEGSDFFGSEETGNHSDPLNKPGRTVVTNLSELNSVLAGFQDRSTVFVEVDIRGHAVRPSLLTSAAISDGIRMAVMTFAEKTQSEIRRNGNDHAGSSGDDLRDESRSSTQDTGPGTLDMELLRWLSRFSGRIVTSGVKRLYHAMLTCGLTLPGNMLDASVADYLLDAGARSHDLDEIAERHSAEKAPYSLPAETGKARQRTMFDDEESEPDSRSAQESASGPESLSSRACLLVNLRDRCEQKLRLLMSVTDSLCDGLDEHGLSLLYRDLEAPLSQVLAKMEYAGIRVDVSDLREQSRVASVRIDELTAEIFDLAGRSFNIDSPKQLSAVLFTDLKLPVIRRTATGASTDQEVLETLAPRHPLPAKIIERRHLIKLRGTYLDALPELVNPLTGRIHATFHQTVASTGRLSSSDPNLQNIPIRTPEGRQVRHAFRAGQDDWTLVCADYSQIELRVLAHFSRDEALLESFRRRLDIHASVAAEVFNVPVQDVTSDQRRIAKAVNFGVIYGQTPWGLAAALGIDKDTAACFIEDYFRKYSGVASFCESVLRETVKTGFARTLMNRRRAISGIRNTTGISRNMSERTAINTVIQGSAADLIKKAMLDVDGALRQSGLQATLLLQIHDELVLECHRKDESTLIPLLRSLMENAVTMEVPLEVDVTSGPNWLEQTDIDR